MLTPRNLNLHVRQRKESRKTTHRGPGHSDNDILWGSLLLCILSCTCYTSMNSLSLSRLLLWCSFPATAPPGGMLPAPLNPSFRWTEVCRKLTRQRNLKYHSVKCAKDCTRQILDDQDYLNLFPAPPTPKAQMSWTGFTTNNLMKNYIVRPEIRLSLNTNTNIFSNHLSQPFPLKNLSLAWERAQAWKCVPQGKHRERKSAFVFWL